MAGTVVDVIFPPVCPGCKRVGELFCERCRHEVAWLQDPICIQCGRPLSHARSQCLSCESRPMPLEQVRTAVLYQGPVMAAIQQFKYEGYFALAQPLAKLMLAAWPRWQHPVDLVIPIPLHAVRQRERGYNQSELMARVLQRYLDWRVEPAALKRVRRTRPQVGLNPAERQANVYGAFIAEPALVFGKRILLVDDVRTTGATLIAAADVLLAAGAASVSGYCLAGVGDKQNLDQI